MMLGIILLHRLDTFPYLCYAPATDSQHQATHQKSCQIQHIPPSVARPENPNHLYLSQQPQSTCVRSLQLELTEPWP